LFLALFTAAVYALFHPELFMEGPVEVESGRQSDPRIGSLFCGAAAVAMGAQLFVTSHRGYVYCDRTQWVQRDDEPLVVKGRLRRGERRAWAYADRAELVRVVFVEQVPHVRGRAPEEIDPHHGGH
jgi:hypothetical protein